MLRRGISLLTLGVHLSLPAAGAIVVAVPSVAEAAPPSYQIGQRLRATRNCTINGIAIKKGVVLNVAAVHKDDKGRVGSVDLSLSGMTISDVKTKTVAANFRRA